jgi:hypothetical protein
VAVAICAGEAGADRAAKNGSEAMTKAGEDLEKRASKPEGRRHLHVPDRKPSGRL